jgi:hypothetical protein
VSYVFFDSDGRRIESLTQSWTTGMISNAPHTRCHNRWTRPYNTDRANALNLDAAIDANHQRLGDSDTHGLTRRKRLHLWRETCALPDRGPQASCAEISRRRNCTFSVA